LQSLIFSMLLTIKSTILSIAVFTISTTIAKDHNSQYSFQMDLL
jgi:hypothetical protein